MPKKRYPTEFSICYAPLPKEREAQWRAGMRAIYDLLVNASEEMILAAEAEMAERTASQAGFQSAGEGDLGTGEITGQAAAELDGQVLVSIHSIAREAVVG